MTQLESLSLYTGAILIGALLGGSLPLLGRMSRSDVLLSFSAGVMLGAAFFHMLPEAVEGGGAAAASFVLVGFLVLYLLERFVLVHLCAEPGPNARLSGSAAALAAEPPGLAPEAEAALSADHAGHAHGPDRHTIAHARTHLHGHLHPGDATGCEVHTLGIAAFVGMSMHTIVDGFALGAASVDAELGVLVFLAILAHKIPNAFSLSAILRAEGHSRARALAMNAAFALMVPLGAGLYLVLREVVHVAVFTSYALAASAGTFLHLSFSDILPDLHRRGGSKWRLSGALLAGVAVMWALRLLRHGH